LPFLLQHPAILIAHNHTSATVNQPASHLIAGICLASILFVGTASAREAGAVDMADFGAKADGSDTTPSVRAALEEVRKGKVTKLTFPPGRYDFHPERASEEYLFVSNNDEGLKRIAFPLKGLKGLEIDGGGSTFVFHGYTVPFLLDHAGDIALRNFTVDFSRPFHSEGMVRAITPQHVDLEFSQEFPHEIRNGVFVFTDGQKASGPATTVTSGEILYPYGSLLAFDPVKRETAFMAKDRYEVGDGIAAEKIGPNRVRLRIPDISAKEGDVLVFSPKNRDVPGFVISDCTGIHLTDITLHHCGGMGVIAQRSADIFVKKLRVTPPPGGKRIVSTTADATHFVNCKGRIELVDCLFEQQKDDATNVHGLYAKITRIFSPHRFEITLIHPQQAGIDFIKTGTRLELNDGPSLQEEGFATVKSVERINKQRTIVETQDALPASVTIGDSVADADANTAAVLIQNCVMRGNRARGILLGSRGPMIIEGNTFSIPGAAILFEGDSRFWFEQAGVRDVVIRGNTFDNCNYGVWGTACIEVGSGIADEFKSTSRYNRNIRIENNLFRAFSPLPLLSIYSVDGLSFSGNRLERTKAYPAQQGSAWKMFKITDSDNVKIDDPATVSAMSPPHKPSN
jgi:hypothetical protein